MRKIKKMLRANLDRTAPDHLKDIMGEEQAEEEKQPVKIHFTRLAVSIGAVAAVLACTIYGLSDSGFINLSKVADGAEPSYSYESDISFMDKQQTNSPSESFGEGGRGDDGYFPERVTSSVTLPDGKEYPVYSFVKNPEKGKELLELIISRTGVSFDKEFVNYSRYESRPGTNDSELLLWGNLDVGMFYYQNMIETADICENYGREEWFNATKEKALEIVSELEPYVGKTVLSDSSVLSEDVPELEEIDDIITYFFTPTGDYSIDGCTTNALLTVSFDRAGKVQTLRSDVSAEERYILCSVTMPENILSVFADQLGGLNIPDAVVTVTKWEIVYTQTPGLDENGLANPYLLITYQINGEGDYTAAVFPD